MRAGRVSGLAAEPAVTATRPPVSHRAQVSERKALFLVLDIASLRQHIPDAIVTVIDEIG